MNAPNRNNRGHSADVRIQLLVNGQILPVAQLGPDFLVLRSAVDHPPGDAELVMSIDGQESRWPVHLAEGIKPAERKTRIARNGFAAG